MLAINNQGSGLDSGGTSGASTANLLFSINRKLRWSYLLSATQAERGNKSASAEDVNILDRGLRHFKKIAEATFNKDVDFPGAGATGGLGAGAKFF